MEVIIGLIFKNKPEMMTFLITYLSHITLSTNENIPLLSLAMFHLSL